MTVSSLIETTAWSTSVLLRPGFKKFDYSAVQQLDQTANGTRAAERSVVGGPKAITKIGAPQIGLCEGGLGARPQEMLRFYIL